MLLPASLRSLAKQFNADSMKGIFLYSFVNKDNLNYIGKVLVLDYFDNVSLEDYNNYYKNIT